MKQFLFCLTIFLYGSILAVGQTTDKRVNIHGEKKT
mgnify:CR=1 FL=1